MEPRGWTKVLIPAYRWRVPDFGPMGRSDDRSGKFSLRASSNRSSRPTGRRLHTDITAQSARHRNPDRVPAREEHRISTLEEHQIPVHCECWRTAMGPPGSDAHPPSFSHQRSRSRNQEAEGAYIAVGGSMRHGTHIHGTQIREGAQGGQHRRTRQPSTTPLTAMAPDHSCVGAHHLSSCPHTNDWCGMTFSQKSRMKQHIRAVHDKYQPLKCGICHREFGKWHDLRSHENVVHGNGKHYQCELCGKAFAKRSNLSPHIIHVHQEVCSGSSSSSSPHRCSDELSPHSTASRCERKGSPCTVKQIFKILSKEIVWQRMLIACILPVN